MFTRKSRQNAVVAADVIVIPRSCSCAIQSITAAPLVDLAHLVGAARVVEDPLGRRGLARVDVGHDPDVPDAVQGHRGALCLVNGGHSVTTCSGEGLVGLRHPVEVVLALEGVALLVEGIQNLAGELVRHVLLAPVARVRDEPAHGERARAALRHLDGTW
jgi:hypothetical protein